MDRLLNAILNDHLQNLKMMRLFMHYFKNLLFDYVIPQHFKMYTFFCRLTTRSLKQMMSRLFSKHPSRLHLSYVIVMFESKLFFLFASFQIKQTLQLFNFLSHQAKPSASKVFDRSSEKQACRSLSSGGMDL